LSFCWFIEQLSPDAIIAYRIKRAVYSKQSKYQKIDVLELGELGLCLVLDGKVQSSEVDEWIYHESLVHPAMLCHPKPSKVLIIGGGEGATAREVLRHRTVERVVMVDLDEDVVKVSKEYLPHLHQGAFDDPRLELVIGDGRAYLEGCGEKFDVIIMDVTDPLRGGPSYLLYTKEFYELAKGRLSDGGAIATHAASAFYDRECFASIYKTMKSVFKVARPYRVWVPSFASLWGFVVGSEGADPLSLGPGDVDRALADRGVSGLRFYCGRVHAAIFTVPGEEEALLEKGRVSTDSEPTFAY